MNPLAKIHPHSPIYSVPNSTQGSMVCHTFHTYVEWADRLEMVFHCSIAQAIRVLSLYLGNQALLMPQYAVKPHRIFGANVYICQLPPWQRATSHYHIHMPETFMERLKHALVCWPAIRLRLRLEINANETVFELFHSSDRYTMTGQKLPPDEAKKLGLVHLRFGDLGNGSCNLVVSIGWNEGFTRQSLLEMLGFLDDYAVRLGYAFGQPPIPQGLFRSEPEEEVFAEELAGKPGAILQGAAGNVASSPEGAPDEAQLSVPENGMSGSASAVNMTAVRGDVTAARVNRSIRPIREPRFYKNTLLKICRLAAHRQAAIAQGRPVPDITPLINQYGLSPNTISKAGRLTAAWQDPAFAWNVVTLLREHSGHTPDEITDYLNHLRTNLNREEWSLVTGAT